MDTYLHVSTCEVNQNPVAKPRPKPMDTYLHVSTREVNQNPVTKPRLKQKLVVHVFFGPKIASEAISQHQTPKKISWGSMPPDPLTLVYFDPGQSAAGSKCWILLTLGV